MSARTYTEAEVLREIALSERRAFVAGAVWHNNNPHIEGTTRSLARPEAERRYPLPKVTRPRVLSWVNDCKEMIEFSVRGGTLSFRNLTEPRGEGAWESVRVSGWPHDPPLFALWADLLANPTEEVDG